MIEISKKTSRITIKNSDKKEVSFDYNSGEVMMEDFDVTHPGEYEKSGNLLEVKEYSDLLFYKFLVDGKHIVIVRNEDFELKEEILSFFGDVDVLFIRGSKDSVKTFENIEAKLVVPFGEEKDIFLNALGQHSEAVSSHKVWADLDGDRTEFVNLA